MALDTKYRPLTFSEVVGQESHVRVLRQIVLQGTGFHQSYVFCGGHGSGKTTLGRILARALLCESPVEGNPCDECASCLEILETGSSECFTEFDAATNSGKDDIKQLVEAVQYDTLSGKQRLYLIDESHRLSKQALDALLKPMEDTVAKSGNKRLVCIFCTTEPERMVGTIFSRCAPAFVIRNVDPQSIAKRLEYICEHEGITYDPASLVLIAEITESHIRDAIKTMAGVATLGSVNVENTKVYLRLDTHGTYLQILAAIGKDLPQVLRLADTLSEAVSPSTCYKKLAEFSMLAYKVSLGAVAPPTYIKAEHLKKIGQYHGEKLLWFCKVFSSKMGHPTPYVLACDLAMLHHQRCGSWASATAVQLPTAGSRAKVTTSTIPSTTEENSGTEPDPVEESTAVLENSGKVEEPVFPNPTGSSARTTKGGVFLEQKAVKRKNAPETTPEGSLPPLGVPVFRDLLQRRVNELRKNAQQYRSAGRTDMGGPGTDPNG